LGDRRRWSAIFRGWGGFIRGCDFSLSSERCPECGSRLRYDYEREEKFCPNCGAVFAFDSVPGFVQVRSSHRLLYGPLGLGGRCFHDRYSLKEGRLERIKHIVSAFVKCNGLPEHVFGHMVYKVDEILSRLVEVGGERVFNLDVAFVAVSDVCSSWGLMDQRAVESWFKTMFGRKFAGGMKAKNRLFKVLGVAWKSSDAVTYVRSFVNRIVNSGEMLSLWRGSLGVRGTEDEFRKFMADVRVEAEKDVVKVKNVSPKSAAGVVVWLKMKELAKKSNIEILMDEEDLSRLLGVDVRQRTRKILKRAKL
jgi:hypothetical protein